MILYDKLRVSKNMRYYVDNTIRNNIPLLIISCGVQGPVENFSDTFKDWLYIFEYAKIISLRSQRDKDLISSVVSDPNKVVYHRDLGYLYPHTIDFKVQKKDLITLIYAGPVHDKNAKVISSVNNSKCKVAIVNMGAIEDDNNLVRIKNAEFPGKKVVKFYGSSKRKEIMQRTDPKGDLDLNKLINLLLKSEKVLTGRYHGMVFCRSLGIPHDTLDMDTNKVLWEQPMSDLSNVIQSSYQNIFIIRSALGIKDTSDSDLKKLDNSVNKLKKPTAQNNIVSPVQVDNNVLGIMSLVIVIIIMIIILASLYLKIY
jgi:hypothetical protein